MGSWRADWRSAPDTIASTWRPTLAAIDESRGQGTTCGRRHDNLTTASTRYRYGGTTTTTTTAHTLDGRQGRIEWAWI
jgi:hypothetical protein